MAQGRGGEDDLPQVDPRLCAAFPGLVVAGAADDAPKGPMQIAMNEDWEGFMAARTVTEWNLLHPERFNFAQLVPDTKKNQIILVPADENAYGAMPLNFSQTENGLWINMRRAMQIMKVTRLPGRVRLFDVVRRTGEDGLEYLAVVTKPSKSRPAKELKKKDEKSPEGQEKEKPDKTA